MPSFTEVIQTLTNFIWKPKQYVDLTAAGSAKELLEYNIIIIGGGMLPFLECDQVAECQRFG